MKSQIKQEGQAAETAEEGDDNLYDDVYELDETNGEGADDDLYDEVYEFPEEDGTRNTSAAAQVRTACND